jgi:uncharacterized membrane protein YfcA
VSPIALAMLVVAAFGAGVVDAIGGGGGLLTVPALLAAGLDPHAAIATNKGQAVFGAVSSFASFWRGGQVDRARAPAALACGFAGSCAGALALLAIRPEPLRPIVLALLILAAAVVTFRPAGKPGIAKKTGQNAKRARLLAAAIAFVIGAYDGFFGPGTGTMLIVAFVVFFGDSLTRASGNAKVVNLASNVAAIALFAWRGAVLWHVSLPMAAGNALGAFVGARLAITRGDTLVRLVVLAVVVALVAKLAFDLAP